MTFFYVESSFLTFAFERQKKDSVQLGGIDSPSLVAPFSLFTFHNKGSLQILQSLPLYGAWGTRQTCSRAFLVKKQVMQASNQGAYNYNDVLKSTVELGWCPSFSLVC